VSKRFCLPAPRPTRAAESFPHPELPLALLSNKYGHPAHRQGSQKVGTPGTEPAEDAIAFKGRANGYLVKDEDPKPKASSTRSHTGIVAAVLRKD
jgi:hypothetical protein